MRVLPKTISAFLLLFFLFAAPSTAEIKSIKIRSDHRPMILFQKFGFTHTGSITVGVSSVSVTSPYSQPDPSRLGFFLLSEELLIEVLREHEQRSNFCVLDSKFISLLFTFRDLAPPPHSSFRKSYPVTYPSEYSLFFANCNPESVVTMDVHTELFNVDNGGYGATKNYLSVGLIQLPLLYSISSLLYLCVFGLWIYVCFNNQRSVHRVHLLMAGLLIIKSLSLSCAVVDNQFVKVTGSSHGWNVLHHIFQFVSNVLLFTVIVLIGSGWPYMKPILLRKEKKVLMIVIVFRALADVAYVVISETGPFIEDWVTWNQVFLLADFICCCAVIFPIVWSIRSVSISKTDEKAGGNLTRFRLFCVVVVGYVLVTRVGVIVMKTMVDYKFMWVCIATYEIGSFVFYLVMFYMFKPVGEIDYVVVDDSDYFVLDGKGEEYDQEAPDVVKK